MILFQLKISRIPMTPAEYCRERTAKSGSSFYYSFLFLPHEQREAITALYAFCREVDDVVDECTDPQLAQTKLLWWRMEIDNLYQGKPEHPVTKSLAVALEHYDLSREHFEEIIDGMQMDLEQSRYATFAELSLYCHRVASVVGLLAAEIFGYSNRRTLKYAHKLGTAFQLTNILRDVREDFTRGRVYIPQDEMQRFGVTETMLNAEKLTPELSRLFAFQAERAEQYFSEAMSLLPEEDRYQQRCGLIMSAIYHATLQELIDDGYHVLEHRVRLTPLRKLWLAWKTLFSESRRHNKYAREAA